ncbi:FAD-binding oxidoreductase [Cupriavidus necator]
MIKLAEECWAPVQAGVAKDQFNAAIEASGLLCAPELSPSNRATICGMIATDASGQGSVLYGKTRDHVMELRAEFIDGIESHSRPLTSREFEAAKARSDRVGHVLRVLDRIRQDDAELIAKRFADCGTLLANVNGILAVDTDYLPAAFRLIADDGNRIVDLWAYPD